MISQDHEHVEGAHSSGNAARLAPEARGILVKGISELLEMTEGLEFGRLPSERYPLPLAMATFTV